MRLKAEEILGGSLYCSPDLTILCRDDPRSLSDLGGISGARLIPLPRSREGSIVGELKRRTFDVVYAFWTGEGQYRKMKLVALRIPARYRDIDIGDGHVFRLTAGAFVRFLLIRWKHPRPTDHSEFAARPQRPVHRAPKAEEVAVTEARSRELREPVRPGRPARERVLILQSADPGYLLRSLDLWKDQSIFREPQYTLFCRDLPEVLGQFRDHPMLSRIVRHSELKGAFRHWRELRRERFDAVVAFFTRDPSYWKIKCLVFLLGARHKVIFNENGDCFFLSWSTWVSHLSYRLAQQRAQGVETQSAAHARALAVPVIKLMLFPLRFLWLLLVWLWLRSSALRASD